MDKDFRERLSFSSNKEQTSFPRENWREALHLLPEPILPQVSSPILAKMPSSIEDSHQTAYLEWVISEDNHSNRVILIPYFRNGLTTYRVPSFAHLFSQLRLSSFDHAWVVFFTTHFCRDDAYVVLDSEDIIAAILWSLARAKRLRLASSNIPLEIAAPLSLRARLRYSEELALWALEADLVLATHEVIAPEHLDFITSAGIVVHGNMLHALPKGAAWVSQLLAIGAWFITEQSLTEALYLLAHRIHDSDFLHHIPQIQCVQQTPLPVLYLRSKYFEQQTQIGVYLAFRYGTCEVFSLWHQEDKTNLPIGFASNADFTLYFRNCSSEKTTESLINHMPGVEFTASKQAWTAHISILWELTHHLFRNGWEIWAEKHKIEALTDFGITLESGLGWFELQPIDTHTGQRIDPLQLIKYLKRKALFIQLGDGQLAVLPERWIEHLLRFLDIGQSDAEKGWCFSSMYGPEIETVLNDEPLFQADEAFYASVERMRSFESIIPLEQPAGLRAILRPYQLEGLTWLNLLCDLHVGGILADDMGLGKTVQVLALLQHRFVNHPTTTAQTILVVCPKSVQGHWLAQINQITPRLKTQMLHARSLHQGLSPAVEHRVLLVSYGLVRHHIETLSSCHIDLLIVDEAQMIKNQSSLTSQAIKQLSATQRFALTGTPIENRFEELVSIFAFLNPYAQLSLGAAAATPEAVRDLVERALHPFVLRRLKEDVLPDLPPKTIEEIILPMTPDQGHLYHELQDLYRHEMNKQQADHALPTEAEAAFFLEGLMRLRQVATYPQQVLGDAFQPCASNKIAYLCEHIPIRIEAGHRMVVFSQFLGFLKRLSEEMTRLTIQHSYIDGMTLDRSREISLFQSNSSIKVLSISLRVGGVGIDLTNTDVCVIADPWWNEAVEKQAIDRLHRFGQKKQVTVLRLISENSIEEKMEILKKNKTALADAIGKTNPDFLNHLKWEDFTEVF